MVVCDNSSNFALGNQKEQYLMTENSNLKYKDNGLKSTGYNLRVLPSAAKTHEYKTSAAIGLIFK